MLSLPVRWSCKLRWDQFARKRCSLPRTPSLSNSAALPSAPNLHLPLPSQRSLFLAVFSRPSVSANANRSTPWICRIFGDVLSVTLSSSAVDWCTFATGENWRNWTFALVKPPLCSHSSKTEFVGCIPHYVTSNSLIVGRADLYCGGMDAGLRASSQFRKRARPRGFFRPRCSPIGLSRCMGRGSSLESTRASRLEKESEFEVSGSLVAESGNALQQRGYSVPDNLDPNAKQQK